MPTLSAHREARLVRQAQAGRTRASAELLEAHEPFLRALVAPFPKRPSMGEEDLLQEARLGFLKAIESFDPDRPERLSTSARYLAAKSVREAVALGQDISVPDRTMARYLAAWEDRPADDYAGALEAATSGKHPMGADTFAAVYTALHGSASLDEREWSAGGANPEKRNLHEVIPSPSGGSSGADLAHALMNSLHSDLHRTVVRYAYGLETGERMPDAEVADALGLSRQKVQRLRTEAREMMLEKT